MEHLVSTKLVLGSGVGSVASSQVLPESYVDLAPVRGTNTTLTVSSAIYPTLWSLEMKQFYTELLAPSTPNENAGIPEPSLPQPPWLTSFPVGTELLMEIGHREW
jgi:hypothetical protein